MSPDVTKKSAAVNGYGITQRVLKSLVHDLHPYVSLRLIQLLPPISDDRISTTHQHSFPV